MSAARPLGALERSRSSRAESSSSSLGYMEQTAPPFRDFVNRTPHLSQTGRSPSPQWISNRRSSSSPPRSRSQTPSTSAGRRSSSVYSRTVSQWRSGEGIQWRNPDYGDEILPPVPLLPALAHSASTPQLVEKQPTPPLLEARTYSPPTKERLAATTRPTRLPSYPHQSLHQPSALLPTPPVSAKIPQKKLHTVSLEKAKAAVHSPGAVHLLPEELRAQTSSRSKSDAHMRVASIDLIAGRTPLEIPEPATLVDNQGRQRTINSPKDGMTTASEYPFPTITHEPKLLDSTSRTDWAHFPKQERKESHDKVVQTLGIDEEDEPRGRTKYRKPRNVDYAHYMPGNQSSSSKDSPEAGINARDFAKEYHSLLTEQYRQHTYSTGYQTADSEEDIRTHMKMVPQPLFQKKPPAYLSGSIHRRESEASVSPYHLSAHSSDGRQSSTSLYGSNGNPFALRLSTRTESKHRRSSTTGSIPISPPTSMDTIGSLPPPVPFVESLKQTPKRPRRLNDNRSSAYYPHIASRKGERVKTRSKAKTGDAKAPVVPALPYNVLAAQLKPATDLSKPSVKLNKFGTQWRNDSFRRKSDENSDKGRVPVHHRLAKGAAKYADLLTKPTELPEARKKHPERIAVVKEASPHLVPSPVRSQQTAVHLGWSDQAKVRFDTVVSPRLPPSTLFAEPQASNLIHTVAPARPLDESQTALREADSPRRKSSIFGTFMDSWREAKAEKRREELKRVIKVVPPPNEYVPPPVQRRLSAFGWTELCR